MNDTKRHQQGKRPEITRNIYNSVRKYDRKSFEAWVNNIYDCGYEDGRGSDEAIDAAASNYDAGYSTGLEDGTREGYKSGYYDAMEAVRKAAEGIKGIGAKRAEGLYQSLEHFKALPGTEGQ